MCEALVELMRPELEAAVKKAKEETRAEERANIERERQRAVAAEEEVQRLREELQRMQKENQ